MFLKALGILLFIDLRSRAESVERSPRVVNGTDANIAEFPFMVSVQIILNETASVHSCGGTILSDYWILTAAHCLYETEPKQLLVEYGATKIADGPNGPKIAYVESTVTHKSFELIGLTNDIGVMKLKTALLTNLFDYIVKLPIKGEYFSTGTSAVLPGWGRIMTYEPISTTLQKVDLQVYTWRDCAKYYTFGNIYPTNICGGIPSGGKGQCSGDSGGPLLVNGIQIGIVSWSIKPCAKAPYPGVFTAVASYIDWIQENTNLKFDVHMFLQAKS